MSKLQYYSQKTLKLTNVLKYQLRIADEDCNFNTAIEQMQSYIRAKGAVQIGPLIQYTRTYINDSGELDIEITMMLQCNHFIHKVEEPYSIESIIRIANCMYCRYTGPENKLKYAYDKIGLEAFEADEELEDDNYTIFLEKNEETDNLTADIFMPRKRI